MHNLGKNTALIAIMVSFFAASAAYAISHNFFASVFLLSAGMTIYVYNSRRMALPENKLEGDTLAFLENLTKQGDEKGMERRIELALNSNFAFYADFRKALNEYALSGDPHSAFARLGKYRTDRYFEVAAILVQESLESGASISYALQSLYTECLEHHEIKGKHIGEITNARALQLMGSVVFFPVFGGLSLNVLKLSAASLPMHAYAVFGSAILLYILIVNMIAAAFSSRGIAARASSLSMRVALAGFVFELSGALASALI